MDKCVQIYQLQGYWLISVFRFTNFRCIDWSVCSDSLPSGVLIDQCVQIYQLQVYWLIRLIYQLQCHWSGLFRVFSLWVIDRARGVQLQWPGQVLIKVFRFICLMRCLSVVIMFRLAASSDIDQKSTDSMASSGNIYEMLIFSSLFDNR